MPRDTARSGCATNAKAKRRDEFRYGAKNRAYFARSGGEYGCYGQPALKIHGKLLACLPSHRSVEPGTLVVRVDFADRAQLLAEAPDVYYLTDHYVDYNGVLVRFSRMNADVLRDLLGMAYKFVTRKARSQIAGIEK